MAVTLFKGLKIFVGEVVRAGSRGGWVPFVSLPLAARVALCAATQWGQQRVFTAGMVFLKVQGKRAAR